MTVETMIKALQTIEDKQQECYFDVTPVVSNTFVFRTIDIIEQLEDDKNNPMIVLSCALQPSDQIFLN